MLLFTILSLVILLIVLVYYYERRVLARFVQLDSSSNTANNKSLPVIPTVGIRQFLQLILQRIFSNKPKHFFEYVIQWMRVWPQQGVGLFVRFLGHIPVVFVHDPESIRHVLNNIKIFPKFEYPEESVFDKAFGKSVAVINGEKWRIQRHMMNPLFAGVERFKAVIQDSVDTCMVRFKEMGTVKDLKEWMSRFTLDVLGDSILGVRLKLLESKDAMHPFITAVDVLVRYSNVPARVIFTWINKLPLKSNTEIRKALHVADSFVEQVAEQVRKEPENYGNSVMKSFVTAYDEKQISREEFYQTIRVLFLAGHDTTANALCYGLQCLALYPEIQEKLRKDVESHENIADMKYLTAFMQEVLRCYCPAPFLPYRTAAEDTQLCGYSIPKGTWIEVCSNSLHFNPALYPNPTKFDPERFMGTNKQPTMMAFGGGPRMCVGNLLSYYEQRLFYTTALKQFDISFQNRERVMQMGLERERNGLTFLDFDTNQLDALLHCNSAHALVFSERR